MNKIKLWKERLDREYESYLKSSTDVFSTDDSNNARKIGEIISCYNLQNCLDVGCGCLPLPFYMKTNPKIKWYGIDPLPFCHKPQYFFSNGCAENLPFMNEYFDGALFASSFDHLLDPIVALQEVHRILKYRGSVFIWITRRKKPLSFKQQERSGVPFDKMHLWGFTDLILNQLLREQKFSIDPADMFTFSGLKEYFVIARKTKR